MSLKAPLRLLSLLLAFSLLTACGGGGGGGGTAAAVNPAIQAVADTWHLTLSDGTTVSLALTADGTVTASSPSPFIDGDQGQVGFLRQQDSLVFLELGLPSLSFPTLALSQDPATPVGILMSSNDGIVGMLERGGPLASNPNFDAADLTTKSVQGFSVQMYDQVDAQGGSTRALRLGASGMAVLPSGGIQGGVTDLQGTPVMGWSTTTQGAPIMVTNSQAGIWFAAVEQGPNPLPQGVSPTAAVVQLVMSTDKGWAVYIVRPDPSIESQFDAWYFCLGQVSTL